MGFWNKLGNVAFTIIEVGTEIAGALAQEGAKKQAALHKEADRRIGSHERKVGQASNSNRMSDPAYQKRVLEEKEKIEKAKARLNDEKEKLNSLRS